MVCTFKQICMNVVTWIFALRLYGRQELLQMKRNNILSKFNKTINLKSYIKALAYLQTLECR